jgi:hypothetical protein
LPWGAIEEKTTFEDGLSHREFTPSSWG